MEIYGRIECCCVAVSAAYLVGVGNIEVLGGFIAGLIVTIHPSRGHIFWHLGMKVFSLIIVLCFCWG